MSFPPPTPPPGDPSDPFNPPPLEGPPPLPGSAPSGYGPPPPGYGPPPTGYGQQPGYGQPYPGQPSYGQPPYGAFGGGQIEHPQGTTILVLGILGIVFCPILAPVAWVMGNTALREIDAQPGRYSNRGVVQAGRLCGMIYTGFVLVMILGAFVLIALAGVSASSS